MHEMRAEIDALREKVNDLESVVRDGERFEDLEARVVELEKVIHKDQPMPTATTDDYGKSCHAYAADYCRVSDGDQWLHLARLARHAGIVDISASLRARAEIGRQRYGGYLVPGNGRDAKRDLQEELLDAMAYLAQVEMEKDEN
jgi:hypothetical protein